VDALTQFAQASAFRRACMAVMACCLRSEEHAKVREAFLEMDSNHDGIVTLGEFRTALDRFQIEDSAVLAVFHALDLSHSGELRYSDFLTAMVSSNQLPFHDELFLQTFRRFDIDGSGFMTQPSLEQMLGKTFDGHEVGEFIEEADLDHVGKISYQEFLRYLKDGSVAESCDPEGFSALGSVARCMPTKSCPQCHVPRLMLNGRSWPKTMPPPMIMTEPMATCANAGLTVLDASLCGTVIPQSRE